VATIAGGATDGQGRGTSRRDEGTAPGRKRHALALFRLSLLFSTIALLSPIDWLERWSVPRFSDPDSLVRADWVVHFLLFALLFYLGSLTSIHRLEDRRAWASSRLTLLLLFYGALIEVLQVLVPSRGAEWADLLSDSAGCLVAAMLCAWRSHGWASRD